MFRKVKIPAITKKQILFALVLLLAFVVRSLLILYAQTNGGDWVVYERFADNIFNGNGFSLSDPDSSVIIPSSGHYYPGFPAFIALVWLLFGKSVTAVLWVQLALFMLAFYWLLTSLLKLTKSINIVFGAGILLALSPLTAGWSRFPLTESLAITASLWFLAEIINSLAVKKLRVLPLSTALAVSIYIRPDTVLMAIALLPVSMHLCKSKREAFKQIVIVFFLTFVPVTAWMVRNVLIGRAPFSMHESTVYFSKGYRAWVSTWAVTEYERDDASLCYPSVAKFYPSRFLSDAEIRKAQHLIALLSSDGSKKIREYVDACFADLANTKKDFYTNVELYFQKSYNLLFSPFSVWGLPVAIGDIDKSALFNALSQLNISQINALLVGHKIPILLRLLTYCFQIILFFFFFLLLLGTIIKNFTKSIKIFILYPVELSVMVSASFLVVFLRLAFFVYIGNLESRYLVEAIPWIECSLGLWIFSKGHLEVK